MIVKIKESLYNNEDKIKEILEDIECQNIHKIITKNQFRFGTNNEGTGSGNSLSIDTLSYKSFSNGKSGDIITLVSEQRSIELGDAIKWLANKLNIKKGYSEKTNIKLPFYGFFKQFSKTKEVDNSPPITYSNSVFKEFKQCISKKWIEDGIDALTQEVFGIHYSLISNRILIPWYNISYEIIGIVGRLNEIPSNDKIPKYLAEIPFSKSKSLFGININYKDILNDNVCYLFEAEKATMQLYSFGMKNGLSMGCNTLSPMQVKLIKSMCVDCILMLDEGIAEEHIIEECKKLKINNPFFKNKVGYIYDKENKYMIKGSKVSPTDLGYETFLKLLNECLIFID